MARARYYSPRLDRDVVSALFHRAKARRVPMTQLATELLRAALKPAVSADGEDQPRAFFNSDSNTRPIPPPPDAQEG
jgi:hypothetical protein